MDDNHVSKFPAEWWNERRRRDYWVDACGLVHVRPDSPTAVAIELKLRDVALDIAARGTRH